METQERSSPSMGNNYYKAMCRGHYNELGPFLTELVPPRLCGIPRQGDGVSLLLAIDLDSLHSMGRVEVHAVLRTEGESMHSDKIQEILILNNQEEADGHQRRVFPLW
jgi:hypothetical protein